MNSQWRGISRADILMFPSSRTSYGFKWRRMAYVFFLGSHPGCQFPFFPVHRAVKSNSDEVFVFGKPWYQLLFLLSQTVAKLCKRGKLIFFANKENREHFWMRNLQKDLLTFSKNKKKKKAKKQTNNNNKTLEYNKTGLVLRNLCLWLQVDFSWAKKGLWIKRALKGGWCHWNHVLSVGSEPMK